MRTEKSLRIILVSTLFAATGAKANPRLEKRCQELQLTKLSPATLGYAAMKCPQGSVSLSSAGKRYFDFFSRLKEERWSDYGWKLNTDDFLPIVEAERFGRLNRDFYLGEVSGQLSRQFAQRSITNEKHFLAFVLRALPCSEGGDGLSLATILGEALSRNAGQLFDLVAQEEQVFANSSGEASKTCRDGFKKLKVSDPVAMNLVSAIKMLWPRPQILSIQMRDQLLMQLKDEKWNELLNRRVRELKIHLQNKY